MKLIHGDCLNVMRTLGRFDCIMADPPDNINLAYNEHHDSLPENEYLEWLGCVLVECTFHSPIVWFSFNAKWTAQFGAITSEFLNRFGDWRYRACVQVFTFGQHSHAWLGNNHRPLWCLYEKDAPFYPDAIRVPSWRQRNGDKRADPRGRVPGDVFAVDRKNLRPLPNLKIDDIHRLLEKISIAGADECWNWTAGTDRCGRGRFKIAGETFYVPRLVWRLVYGTDPLAQLVCHTCDNPSCCNPAHLFLGTDADNHADRTAKGRGPNGSRNGRTKLSEHDVITIHLAPASESNELLAEKYGVSRTAIRLIREGITWQHVTRNRAPGSVFDFPRVTGNSKQRCDWHPTQLHEELVERVVKFSSSETGRVLDPFAGTGTTLRVCDRIGRDATAIEIDRTYCERIAASLSLNPVGTGVWSGKTESLASTSV